MSIQNKNVKDVMLDIGSFPIVNDITILGIKDRSSTQLGFETRGDSAAMLSEGWCLSVRPEPYIGEVPLGEEFLLAFLNPGTDHSKIRRAIAAESHETLNFICQFLHPTDGIVLSKRTVWREEVLL